MLNINALPARSLAPLVKARAFGMTKGADRPRPSSFGPSAISSTGLFFAGPILATLFTFSSWGTPSPLIFWNHEIRATLPPKSLRNKDLYAKYSGQRS